MVIKNMQLSRTLALVTLALAPLTLAQAQSPAAGLESPASAEVCGDCHRAAQEAWKTSSHAHAMDSRVFQDVLHYTEVDLGAGARQTCLGCHAPLALMTGDQGLEKKVSWEGVSCDYCHSVREISMNGTNPKARLEFSRTRTGPWKDDNPGQHGALFSELDASSSICAPCHEYRNALGFEVLSTFSEWQASRYAKEGRQCQSCHMPSVGRVALVQRVVATPTDVERHSHCQSCHATPAAGAVANQPAQGVAAAGSGLREHGKLNLHEIGGSQTTELLKKAIEAQLAATREGNRVRVNVEVTNRAAGHYVPTGSPLRQLVLEVRGETNGGGHFLQERVYRRTVGDREAKPVEREYLVFDRGVKATADTRLAPDEKRSETFLFDVPQGVEVRVNVALRYYYSPLGKTESQKNATFLTLSTVVR